MELQIIFCDSVDTYNMCLSEYSGARGAGYDAHCTCSPTLLYIYCKCILLLQIRGNRLAFGSVEIILSIIQLLMAGYKQCFTVSNTLTYCIFCGETLLDKMAALHDRSEWQE